MSFEYEKKSLIRSVDLKLVHADSQVRKLCDGIAAWMSRNQITARCELREERLGFRLILEDFAEPPELDEWAIVTGECVHNLRSALDNLAFALSRLQCDPPAKPEKIGFPIFSDKTKFEKSGRVRISQMCKQAAERIELLQPFQRDRPEAEGTPETDALVLLQRLNNDDKHRVPSLILLAPKDIAHSCAAQFFSHKDAEANVPPEVTISMDALHPGAVILEHKTNRPLQSVQGGFYGTAIVSIQTAKKREPVDQMLPRLNYYTALIVDQFRDFFK